MDSQPLVTIGVPNYNYSKYVIEALESIVKQTYRNIEIIIVDDCSSDNSNIVIDTWVNAYIGNIKINFIKNEVNIGIAKVCNLILKNAHGEYIQFLDADDYIFLNKIETQVRLLQSRDHSDAFVYSNVDVVNETGELISNDYFKRIGYNKENMPNGSIHEDLLFFNFIPMSSVLIKTDILKKIGGFNESILLQDYSLWLKLTEKYNALYMQEITAVYRIHTRSFSNNTATNPKLVDAVLTTKYKYYTGANQLVKKQIRMTIRNLSVYLYKYEYLTTNKWLALAFYHTPSIKTFLYFLSHKIGIPYSFYEKIKKTLKWI